MSLLLSLFGLLASLGTSALCIASFLSKDVSIAQTASPLQLIINHWTSIGTAALLSALAGLSLGSMVSKHRQKPQRKEGEYDTLASDAAPQKHVLRNLDEIDQFLSMCETELAALYEGLERGQWRSTQLTAQRLQQKIQELIKQNLGSEHIERQQHIRRNKDGEIEQQKAIHQLSDEKELLIKVVLELNDELENIQERCAQMALQEH